MKLAVVILNWNGKKLLEKFIPSIVLYNKPGISEIYVVDNASTDNSVEFIKINFPSIKIIQNDKNIGFAKGYNYALQHINADIYALLNSDILITEKWLDPIIHVFNKESNTAIVQPKILNYDNNKFFDYSGAGGGFIDLLGYPYCRGRIFMEIEKDNGQFNDISNIFWASGACFFIRSKVYHQLGGFDETYFAHQEEIDLCWRAINKGYSVKYVGTSTVYHIGGATLNKTNPKKTFLNFRNNLFSLVKNLPKKYVFFIPVIRIILDGIAGLKFFLELRPKHTIAIIKAHINFYIQLPVLIKKRKTMPNKVNNYFSIKSVVWKHFILKINKFIDLK